MKIEIDSKSINVIFISDLATGDVFCLAADIDTPNEYIALFMLIDGDEVKGTLPCVKLGTGQIYTFRLETEAILYKATLKAVRE